MSKKYLSLFKYECKKYLSLFKYELKKLIWLYGAMILFFILYISNESIITANEANSLLTINDYTYITFNILNPKIYFFYIAFVELFLKLLYILIMQIYTN